MNMISAGKDEKKNLLKLDNHEPKSSQKSPAVGDFYGTGIKIWAGFGPIMSNFLGWFFKFSWAKKNKNIVVSALQKCIEDEKKKLC